MNFGVSGQLLFGNIRFKTVTVAFDLPDVTKLATVQFKFHQIKLLVYERFHCDDVIMGAMASQITNLTIVYSTVYSDADQRKHQSSASLAFVRGIHWDRWLPRTKGQ